jgi:hypothetical protein
MFDFIVLRRTGMDERVLDVGLLAETLLFYQKTHLLLDNGSLDYLLKKIGGDQFLELIGQRGVTAAFLRERTGTLKMLENGIAFFNFAQFKVSGSQEKKHMNDREWLQSTVERALGSSRETKRIAKKLCATISFPTLNDPSPEGKDLPAIAREDLSDAAFVRRAVGSALSELLPSLELPEGWTFRPHIIGPAGQQQFIIETDLNFDALNARYHERIPASHSSLSSEYLVNYILGAKEAISLASRYMAEFVTDPATTAVIKLNFEELLRKRNKQTEEIDVFQEMHLPQARKIREVINSGERTLDEFMDVLDKAQRFKEWLASRNPDQRLLHEYYAETTRQSWLEKLPTKVSRWTIATGLGAAVDAVHPIGATALGLGISFFDAMLLDKILKGWRPNQFIDDVVGPFVGGAE